MANGETSKYNPRAILDKSPNTIAVAVFGVVNFVAGCIFYAQGVEPSPVFIGLLLQGETALIAVLNLLIIQPHTQTNEVVASKTREAAVSAQLDGLKVLAENAPPVPPEVVADAAGKAQAASKKKP